MSEPIIQIRDFGDGTWSVVARVETPEKAFYEHPAYIELTKERAQDKCDEVIKEQPSIEEILTTWDCIGN